MKHVYVYSYNVVSNGAKELAHALGSPRIRHNSSRFRGRPFKKVINWGSSEVPKEVSRCEVWNEPGDVRVASNKLLFFRKMTDAPEGQRPRLVPWTASKSEAQKWLDSGKVVVCRTILTGHSGAGIVLVGPEEDHHELPNAPLYTQYIHKSHEFRIHIVAGRIIDAARKVRDRSQEPDNWKIRSHDNGFVYIRGGVTIPSDCEKQALAAFTASRLDFTAADVIWSEKYQQAWVLELNNAPGLEGSTILSYANAFRKELT